MRSSSPLITSTGHVIDRYMAALMSKAGAIARASTVCARTAPEVSAAHANPSSICLVEWGSGKMLQTKCSAKSA